MRTEYTGFIKPFIEEAIHDTYENSFDFLSVYHDAGTTQQKAYDLLVQKVFTRIKGKAVMTRLDRAMKEEDTSKTSALVFDLLHELISLEQMVYGIASCADDPEISTKVERLYQEEMNTESTELLELIKLCVEEAELFKGAE